MYTQQTGAEIVSYAGHGGSTFSAPHGCRLTMHKTPRQFCAARLLPESAAPLPGQSAAVKSLPISVPPPKHFLVVCSDSKRPCFRKPPDPYRNMWPLCLVFRRPQIDTIFRARFGNVKKCAVGKHPKSEKHGNTAQFSEVERSGTQENCGGIGSGCRLRLRPLPVLRRRQSQRVARIDPNAVVVDKNIAENDRFDLFSR